MTDLKIEAGKEYILRNGWRMRCYATDGGGACPVQGAIWNANTNEWDMGVWRLDGRAIDGRTDYSTDIISEAPKPIEVDCWLWVYPDDYELHDTRWGAAKFSLHRPKPQAQFRVTRMVQHGEGM